MGTEASDERSKAVASRALDVQINTSSGGLVNARGASDVDEEVSHPSRTALPNGRVELEPPKKSFQIVSAKVWA